MEKHGFLFHFIWGAILAASSLILNTITELFEKEDLLPYVYHIAIFGIVFFAGQLSFAMYKAKKPTYGKALKSGLLICFFNLLIYIPLFELTTEELLTSSSQTLIVFSYYLTVDTFLCLIIAAFVRNTTPLTEDIIDR